MRYVEAAGIRVSAIGLGTWQFGSGDWGYGSAYASEVAPALVRRALELGITLIDTAETYGSGASERIVGRALRHSPGTPFVATKLTPILPLPAVAVSHAAASRARLGVEVIDLYQLHFPNPIVPIRLQAAALRAVVDRGIARNVGVSNHSLRRWRAIEAALGRPVVSNQVEFSLARIGPADDLLPHATSSDRLVIAFSPLGQGLLAGDHRPRANGARRLRQLLGAARTGDVGRLRDVVRAVADGHAATMAQVALAWLLRHPNVVAIPGARTVAQLEENAAAAELTLTDAEFEALSVEARRLADARARPGSARR